MMTNTRRTLAATFTATALFLTACGGNDGAATTTSPPPETTATPAPETTTPPETTAPPATEPPDTEPPDTEPPATDPPLPLFTSAELGAVLPEAADLGPDWEYCCGETVLDPPANEGPGMGTCAGPNAAARAVANGVVAMAQGATFTGPDERVGSTTIYVFADENGAAGFLQTSYEQIDCEDPITWERTQSSEPTEPDEFNGFGTPDFAEGETWAFAQVAQSDYADDADDPGEADEVLAIAIEEKRSLTAYDITFAQTQMNLEVYQRFGNVVVATWINGRYDFEGYFNLDDLVSFQPDADDLAAFSSLAVPLVLSRLGLA